MDATRSAEPTVEQKLVHDVLNCQRSREPGDDGYPCPDCADAAPFLASQVTNLITDRDEARRERRLADAAIRKLDEKCNDLRAQVDGMRAEGCAALDALASIFGLVTPQGMKVTEREKQVADIAADVIATAKSCTHKAVAEALGHV